MDARQDVLYAVGFSVFPGIGPHRYSLLCSYFGSAKAAWEAPVSELLRIKFGDKRTQDFDRFRKTFDASAYMSRLHHSHIGVLPRSHEKYPARLREIPDAPIVLYIKGDKSKGAVGLDRTIAVVGTRNVTPYGKAVTEQLVSGLVAAGFTIVSGLAYGVDAQAHQSAIDAGGKTIAVLGCGIDIIAPPSNARLYHDIAGGFGAIVSEMPLGMRPQKGLFPARNRIISGLSLGVVVIEGARDSGSLITAKYAAEQGRDVFAVPGPITSPYSGGPASLLKNGAQLVESAADIVDALGIAGQAGVKSSVVFVDERGDNELEQKVLTCLSSGHQYIDEIVRRTRLTTAQVAATLTILEMKGKITDLGEKTYGLKGTINGT